MNKLPGLPRPMQTTTVSLFPSTSLAAQVRDENLATKHSCKTWRNDRGVEKGRENADPPTADER